MKPLTIAVAIAAIPTALFGAESNAKERELNEFIAAHVQRIEPLARERNLTYWRASTSGKSEDYEELNRLNLAIREIYSNPEEFARLRESRESGESGGIVEPRLRRQLDKLYYAYLENQMDPELLKQIVDLSTDISKRFKTFRSTLDGKMVTQNDINEILTIETDSHKREKAWRASKQSGAVIGDDLIRLVKLRNQAARKLGFDNYHTLSLTTAEQSREELDRIFGELDELTREPFRRVKEELDRVLAKRYNVEPSQLMPWHYHDPFFQRGPLVYELDLDGYYAKVNIREIAERYYVSIGLPVDDILGRSDLYDREGKDPNAFSTDIDRRGDVRILCNLTNTERWMETLLHELGHAVYSKYHDPDEAYLLRSPAHAFTTEGTAMFFGRQSRNAAWMQQMLGLSDDQRRQVESVSRKYMQLQQLVFARWAMVMYQFEKQLYANPDQDLDALWWDMRAKYQRLRKPQPVDPHGWASKLHFTGAACYYHNYMLGELFASQVHQHVVHNVLRLESDDNVSCVGDERIGAFFRDKVFAAGAVYPWNEMVKRATGEPLTAKHFVSQFVR